MWQLKPLRPQALPEALAKAERYRLLNEPTEAESICLDILQVEPDQQEALVMLILALTDQFGKGAHIQRTRDLIPRLRSEYERAYYSGLARERWAKALHRRGSYGANFDVYDCLREAMDWYEKAEALRPEGNDDAILRWNACARMLMNNPGLRPKPAESVEPVLSE